MSILFFSICHNLYLWILELIIFIYMMVVIDLLLLDDFLGAIGVVGVLFWWKSGLSMRVLSMELVFCFFKFMMSVDCGFAVVAWLTKRASKCW